MPGLPKQELNPGEEVEVSKKRDPNDGRSGYVRGGSERERYQVTFEPGEADETYNWFDLRPTGRHIDPKSLPKAVTDVHE